MWDEVEKTVLAITAGSGVYFVLILLLYLVGVLGVTGHIIAMILSLIFSWYAYREL